ncbi:MAG: hypothetical protein JNJ72_20025, partial [Anaerolineales bacterium]|nr:hypothetical protein [Anaerolineales bacterium]
MSRLISVLLLVLPFSVYSQNPMIEPMKFLALGDSYTIGESVPENERWPVQLAKAMSERGQPVEAPRIIATTGWRTDQLKKAIIEANLSNDWGMVSLL